MPINPLQEMTRQGLTEEWRKMERYRKDQTNQYLTQANLLATEILSVFKPESVIRKHLARLPGTYKFPKNSPPIPLNGLTPPGHIPLYRTSIEHQPRTPGDNFQVIGKAGSASISVNYTLCRDDNCVYLVVIFTHEHGRTHKPTAFYFDSRKDQNLPQWLTKTLNYCNKNLS